MDLKGKKTIVTGGVRGLGRCLVEKLLDKGAQVAVFDIDATALERANVELPEVEWRQCDLSEYGQVVEAVANYHSQFGSPDVLVNNAGILYSAPLLGIGPTGVEKHDVKMWNRVLAVNLSAVFYLTACVAEKMLTTRTRGVIVNISSVSAAGNAGQSAYSAAKAGVNALTATWAKELSPWGIRVLAVAPGYTDTESTQRALSETVLKEIVRRVPLKRLGKPDEIADGVVHVIENDFFNGKVFELDGGLIV